ncbi:hypothetical protein [Clostridium sp. UBA6640]|nr:hypothetical protein [Clostridium sp. UBA6640]
MKNAYPKTWYLGLPKGVLLDNPKNSFIIQAWARTSEKLPCP